MEPQRYELPPEVLDSIHETYRRLIIGFRKTVHSFTIPQFLQLLVWPSQITTVRPSNLIVNNHRDIHEQKYHNESENASGINNNESITAHSSSRPVLTLNDLLCGLEVHNVTPSTEPEVNNGTFLETNTQTDEEGDSDEDVGEDMEEDTDEDIDDDINEDMVT
ncbi:unnamed protein product [Ambrosiozyma monospora]|uniref:Unnamed protein product n=1 Tax=Ambrosiozyma monospora TaxID=43982 RepID=A0ACB5SYZ6_AMBMO|nr:unnamed protein product [Ambrosiozyma monospora]